jgi:hypothetical protein
MFRVIACVALVLSDCAHEAAPTQVVRKTVINVGCPTDDEFRDMAIAASRGYLLEVTKPQRYLPMSSRQI